MDHRVESLEVGRREVADVEVDRRHEVGCVAEVAAAVEERVEPHDVVARFAQLRREHGADVAAVPGHDHAHQADPASRTRPASISRSAAPNTASNGSPACSATSSSVEWESARFSTHSIAWRDSSTCAGSPAPIVS